MGAAAAILPTDRAVVGTRPLAGGVLGASPDVLVVRPWLAVRSAALGRGLLPTGSSVTPLS